MPLKALIDGTSFYAEDLTEENKKQDFRCPICGKEYQAVIPRKEIINYFRHNKGEAHGEPDGPEHRAMRARVVDSIPQ